MINSYIEYLWGMHWLWWILGAVIIICIFVPFIESREKPKKKDTPLEILRKKYAAGEINTVEYLKRKKMLPS